MKTENPSRRLAWFLMVVWTALVLFFLLMPSKDAIVDAVSDFVGDTDTMEELAHFALTFIETAVIYNLLRSYITPRSALWIAVLSMLALGLILEVAQYWIPTRGVKAADLAANWLGVGMSALLIRTTEYISHRLRVTLS